MGGMGLDTAHDYTQHAAEPGMVLHTSRVSSVFCSSSCVASVASRAAVAARRAALVSALTDLDTLTAADNRRVMSCSNRSNARSSRRAR